MQSSQVAFHRIPNQLKIESLLNKQTKAAWRQISVRMLTTNIYRNPLIFLHGYIKKNFLKDSVLHAN